MYTKGRRKSTIRFSLKPPAHVKTVQLAGDFNNWVPARMRKLPDGTFVSTVRVQQGGSYQYKYVVDSQWTTDPDNGEYVSGPVGMNSVAMLE